MEHLDELILECNAYIKSKTNERFAFAGSCGLYLQGISLGRDIHDIDVKFLDINVKKALALGLTFEPKIDVLDDFRVKDIEYLTVEVNGEPILAESIDSIIDAKKSMLDFLMNRAKIMDEPRIHQKEKLIRDLNYLKETYNLT